MFYNPKSKKKNKFKKYIQIQKKNQIQKIYIPIKTQYILTR